jgi:hypothetical protein
VRRKKGRDNVVAEIKKAQILGGLAGCICTEARQLSRRYSFDEFESLAAPPAHAAQNLDVACSHVLDRGAQAGAATRRCPTLL